MGELAKQTGHYTDSIHYRAVAEVCLRSCTFAFFYRTPAETGLSPSGLRQGMVSNGAD
jgi:hypothetical protein